MAIKMDRQIDAVDIAYFLNETAEKGVILSISTAGSGIALDSTRSVATVSALASGTKPLGMLLNDFVNIDQTRQNVNWLKDQSQIGNKCTIMTKGWAVTNKVQGTPNAGDNAVLRASGLIGPVAFGNDTNPATNPAVGRFRSSLSEDGYAKVYIDLA